MAQSYAPYYKQRKHELDDRRIVKDLNRAAKYYENGAIVEAYAILQSIVESIDEFVAYMNDPDD